ncbi:MAG TPA: hypothetical protein PKY81_10410 [bacterium]|nr:hypothetical protein [bacterium]
MDNLQHAIELLDNNFISASASLHNKNAFPKAKAELTEKCNLYMALRIMAETLEKIEIQINCIDNKIK